MDIDSLDPAIVSSAFRVPVFFIRSYTVKRKVMEGPENGKKFHVQGSENKKSLKDRSIFQRFPKIVLSRKCG